jgi:hypothetical protein
VRGDRSRPTLDDVTNALLFVYLAGLTGCLWVSTHMGERDVSERSTKELVHGDQTFRGLAVMWTTAFGFLCISILLRG